MMVSDEALAKRYGVTLGDILDWCVEGRFEGAYYHRSRRRWYVPEPVRYHHFVTVTESRGDHHAS